MAEEKKSADDKKIVLHPGAEIYEKIVKYKAIAGISYILQFVEFS